MVYAQFSSPCRLYYSYRNYNSIYNYLYCGSVAVHTVVIKQERTVASEVCLDRGGLKKCEALKFFYCPLEILQGGQISMWALCNGNGP